MKIDFKKHLRIHPGDKPYPCNQCPNAFSQNSHLKKRLRIHSSENNQCHKGFSQNDGSKKHLRIHLLKSHILAINVPRHSLKVIICGYTQVRSHILVTNVPRPSLKRVVWRNTQVKSYILVISVPRPSLKVVLWRTTWEYIEVNRHIFGTNIPRTSHHRLILSTIVNDLYFLSMMVEATSSD